MWCFHLTAILRSSQWKCSAMLLKPLSRTSHCSRALLQSSRILSFFQNHWKMFICHKDAQQCPSFECDSRSTNAQEFWWHHVAFWCHFHDKASSLRNLFSWSIASNSSSHLPELRDWSLRMCWRGILNDHTRTDQWKWLSCLQLCLLWCSKQTIEFSWTSCAHQLGFHECEQCFDSIAVWQQLLTLSNFHFGEH